MSRFIQVLGLCVFLFLAMIGNAAAEGWIRLDGPPAGSTYQAPAVFELKVNWGATTTGPKAEYIDGLRLLRNGTVVTIQAGGAYREAGLSPGTYYYELRADAVRNLPDGDQTRRSLVSAVGPITVNAPPAPFDGAEFVGSTIPGPLQHRTPYTFTATVRNSGNTTWPAGYEYQLGGAHDSYASTWSFSNVPVPHPVAPGETVTFNINVTAPPPGEYGFQLQMMRNGVGRFGASSGLATLWVNGPINKAHFIDQNVPSQMEAGKTYNVSLRMNNAGNTTWSSAAGYALGALNDSTVWGTHRLALPGDIGPGATAVISAQVRAPTTPGVYAFQWQMVQDGVEWFGVYTTNVAVTVTAPPSVVAGNIDGFSSDGTTLRGWACSTNRNDPIDVHLYVRGAAGQGGVFLAGARADQASEPGVATACKASGTNYRFAIPLTYAQRREQVGQPLYVHGISPVGGANSLIGSSGTYRVQPAPVGSISASPNPCTIPWGQSACSTTVQWLVSEGDAQLWGAVGNGAGAPLAAGPSGSIALTNVTAAGLRLWLVSRGETIAEAAVSTTAGARPGEVLSRANYGYDELGRMISRSDGAGTAQHFKYDGNGNQIELIDGAGSVQRSNYDALGRVVSSQAGSGSVQYFHYDGLDRIVRIVDQRGLQTRYERDGFGRAWLKESPDTGTSTYSYAAPARVTGNVRSDGAQATMQYDGIGRVLSVVAAGDERHFTYDGCVNGTGRMCTASTSQSVVSFKYAQDGQLTERSEGFSTQGMQRSVLEIRYEASGRLWGITYPDGVVADYTYAGARLAGLNVTVAGVSRSIVTGSRYTPSGALAELALGNGMTYRNTFDLGGRLSGRSAVSAGNGTALQELAYTFDAAGHIRSIEDRLAPQLTQVIEHDRDGRLSRLSRSGLDHIMTYDANGNWLSHTDQVASRQYAFETGSNRLLGYLSNRPGETDRVYTHDAMGNRIAESSQGDVRSYRYDGFSRMVGATINGQDTQYVVNALGQRSGKLGGDGSRISYAYLGQNQIMSDGAEGQGWSNYIWFMGEIIAVTRGPNVYTVRTDHLGRPEFAANDVGQVRWKAYNYAYGRTVTQDDIGGLNVGLPGHYFDSESGLWYSGFRDYDANVGRYLQSDPIGKAGGSNTYVYASSNPMEIVDPLGLIGYVCQKGENIGISIPINFSGGSAADVATIKASIERAWSGRIGSYNVVTRVQVYRMSRPAATVNNITLTQGAGRSYVDAPNLNSGEWFVPGQWSADSLYPHEAGHLLGLVNEGETGIMSSNLNGARPDGKNLEDVLDPWKNRTIVRGCGCASQ